ncbi:MAG: hypothetical protein WD009_09865 [Phycisphaeraceae bacterium]
MTKFRTFTRFAGAVSAAAAAGLIGIATPASAQEDIPPVNRGNVSFELGAEIVTEYWFRGIGQQNKGFILQPFAQVNVVLPSIGDVDVEGYLGSWNSFHDRNPAGRWYEHDLIVGATFGLPGDFSVDLAYVNYYSPAASASFAEEVQVGVAYDDRAIMEEFGLEFALQPHALLAIETHGGADIPAMGDGSTGTYFEVGIAPSMVVVEAIDYPITVTVPATAGFNFGDYYEAPDGSDSTFGYFQVGVVGGVPLAFIPEEYGSWTATAGVHLMWLGSSVREISEAAGTGSRNFNMHGSVGVTMNY